MRRWRRENAPQPVPSAHVVHPQQPPPCHAWDLSRLPRMTHSCNRFPRQPARGAGASLPAQQPRRLQQPLHSTHAALLALQPELTSWVSLGVAVLDVMGDRGGCRERLCFCEGRGPLIEAMDGCASASWGCVRLARQRSQHALLL